MKNRIFLIDGHALIFKMYYAFLGHPMVNAKGVDTSVLFGTAKYILELIEKERPTHLGIAFDPPGGSFRNTIYPQYKANRSQTPQLVIDALNPLIKMAEAMHIPVLMLKGFEADDVVGSAVKKFQSPDNELYMVTPDKDYGQLVSDNVYQYKPDKTSSEIIGVQQVCDKWKINSPSQVIEMLAMCGDSADNVPGIQGVGPVTAAKLLLKYASIDGIYEHLDELSPRQKELFEAGRGHIGLSKELVTIKTDIPLDYSLNDLELKSYNTPEINAWLRDYEMPSLIRLLSRLCPESKENAIDNKASNVLDYKELDILEFKKAALSSGKFTLLQDGEMFHLALPGMHCLASFEQCGDMISDESLSKCGEDLKGLYKSLMDRGLEMRGRAMDINVMHYLINPESNHSAQTLSLSYLGIDLQEDVNEQVDLFSSASQGEEDKAKRSIILSLLEERLDSEMDETLHHLYNDIEAPLIYVLARIERVGVRVDISALKHYSDALKSEMLEKELYVRECAGNPSLNVSSPKQIGELLYEQMRLDPKVKKTKNGSYPTDEQTLEKISSENPVVDAILEYRALRKLVGTYIDPFPSYVSAVDGRIHTTFNQSLTSTGRLSSSNPNLQNIPIRTERGREIRKAFVSGLDSSVIMAADYSQIELRLMAHLCGDEHLCAAFVEGRDVHAATASKVFHKPIDEVSQDDRRSAKAVNFGIMYGMSAHGLSQRLKCSWTEAKTIIDDYYASFPSIKLFIENTISEAKKNGYVSTLFGRRRYVPGINSNNAQQRSEAERNAVNAPIQGCAADIIKLAMIEVDKQLRDRGLKSRIVLQIHDELLLEVPKGEIDVVSSLLKECMEGVVSFTVPITIECKYGNNWLEAH